MTPQRPGITPATASSAKGAANDKIGAARATMANRRRIISRFGSLKGVRDSKNSEQKKAALCTAQTRSDENITTSKNARKISSTSQEQSVATPGDLVPIVFCKRTTTGPQSPLEVGGVWMQPTKLKQGSYNFVGIFLYPISQGEVVSTPAAPQTYVGDLSLTARGGTIPTLTTYYSSTSTMASAKNVCPITSGKIFCDPDTNSFIDFVATKEGFKEPISDFYNFYHNQFELTIGAGDTSNTVINHTGTGLRVFEVISGDDRTSAYLANISPATGGIKYNASLTAGRAVGTIFNFFNVALGQYNIPTSQESDPANQPHYTVYGSSAEDRPVTFERQSGSGSIDTQEDTSLAATDDTLGGVVFETHLSPVADPTNFPSTYDFTDYADITFLEIQGDIYDESDPVKGEYKTTTRQLSVLIEEGVKVALYSQGTPGTTGASHHFVDLAMHLFALNKRVVAGTTADIASPIDTSNLQSLSAFHTNFGLFFNGIIEQNVNIIDFISTMAPFYFLSFVSENGRYAFKPILPLSSNAISTGAITPATTFTDADIIPGTFQKEYIEGEERRDVQISVVFREAFKDRIGLQKSTQIRFSNVASDARVIQYDMTDCCVTGGHARKFAKLQLATRKHSTHSVSFDVSLVTSGLSVTDIIKVQRVRETNKGDDRTESEHYQITSIQHGADGTTRIGATHFPLNASNVSKISDEVLNGSYTFA